MKAHQDEKKPYADLDIAGRMNCDADELATKFRLRMEDGEVEPIQEGYRVEEADVTISIGGMRIQGHYSHKIRSSIQGAKQRDYLQKKHEWSDEVWDSIDRGALKGAYLSLGPMKRLQCSKRIHGWLNTGRQKKKISPSAVEAHKCPRCFEPNETQEHVLTCRAVSAHRKRYALVIPTTSKMTPNPRCPVQQVFVACFRSWLENPETPSPDVSKVHEEQRDFLEKALREQDAIGWDLGLRGYLSKHWVLAVAANPNIQDAKDKDGKPINPMDTARTWARKVLLQLWDFAFEMWDHRNKVLHDTKLESSRVIRDEEVNQAITELYEKVDTFAAEDRWYFEMPLALRLQKPLRSRKRWLTLARVLASKSGERVFLGQTPLTAFFQVLRNPRRVVNASLEPVIAPVRQLVQTSLSAAWRPQDPVESRSP